MSDTATLEHVVTGTIVYPGQHLYTCSGCGFRTVITLDPPDYKVIDHGDLDVKHHGNIGPLQIDTGFEVIQDWYGPDSCDI